MKGFQLPTSKKNWLLLNNMQQGQADNAWHIPGAQKIIVEQRIKIRAFMRYMEHK